MTVAVLVAAPEVVTVATIVRVAEAPGLRLPTVQVGDDQVPWLGVADTSVSLAGSAPARPRPSAGAMRKPERDRSTRSKRSV